MGWERLTDFEVMDQSIRSKTILSLWTSILFARRADTINSSYLDKTVRRPLQTNGDVTMRFLCIAKSDEKTEAGAPPDKEMCATMGEFVEQQRKSGVLLATEGLHPSSKAARVRLSQGKLTVTDGPFTEAKEVIASFALIQVMSKDEAIENVARFLKLCGQGEADIYQVYEMEDFAP
jgi:hypothetical protein